ncbi:MAG: PQQ-like beta-propeller repeat protein [Planctomycetota bacterium]|nr:PQQ-like beta-propeller repeat protein [Planctomycetota bacterium]
MTFSEQIPDNTNDDQSGGEPIQRSKKRLSLLKVSLIVFGLWFGANFTIGLYNWAQEERTRLLFIGLDGMCFYLAVQLAAIIAGMIAIFHFRPSGRQILMIGALVIVAYLGFANLVRVDDYFGNRTPRYAWVWTPKAEDKIKTYLTSRTTKDLSVVAEDLFQGTDSDFPELLGKGRTAQIDRFSLPANWDEKPPQLLWRHPVGLGWSSFAIVGNAAVNLEQRDDQECVVCYDVRTGSELWSHGEKLRFNHEHGDGPRTTPSIHDGRVYSFGATGVLTCIDFKSGKLIWKQSVFDDPASQNLLFGMSGSPLVHNGLVVVTPGAGKGGSAIAFDAKTGSEVWRSGDDPASYSSPVAVSLCGHNQILSFNGAGLQSYNELGESLWLQPWVTQGDSRVNVAQPMVLSEDQIDDATGTDSMGNIWAKVLISSGYDKGTALLKITRANDQWFSEVLWESKQLKSKLSNFVVYANHAYGFDNGILACIDLKNGQQTWKRGRYGHGKMLLVQDKLLILAESGEVVLVHASSDSHQELTKFEALSSKTWNNIALAGDILVVRNDREAAAFRLPLN